MPQAPLLGAPPSSSVLRSLLRLPCSPPLRFSVSASAVLLIANASPYRGSNSLPPETPPPPQARPSRRQATSARPGVLAERDRGLRPKPTQVRAAQRRRGCRLLFYVSGGGGRCKGPGPFSWKGRSGRFFIKEAQWLLLQREGWRAGQTEKRDPFLGYFSLTRKD